MSIVNMHESHITEVTMSVAPLDNTPYHLNCNYSTQWVAAGFPLEPD